MVTDSYTNSSTETTGTSCCCDCRTCTMDCPYIFIYIGDNGTGTSAFTESASATITLSVATAYGNREPYTPVYRKKEKKPRQVCEETIRFWRKDTRKIQSNKVQIGHKPITKLRAPYSMSGWLDRKGRLRKKGKK